MESHIFAGLNSLDYTIASKVLNSLLDKQLELEDIKQIMSIENKLIIADFLGEYTYFSDNDLAYINSYITINIDNEDRLFVSDLIEFAIEFNLSLPYEKCLDFLLNHKDENAYVLLAAIDYIFENLNFYYIDTIVLRFENIINNPEHNQSAQVKASFALFRITLDEKYLLDLECFIRY